MMFVSTTHRPRTPSGTGHVVADDEPVITDDGKPTEPGARVDSQTRSLAVQRFRRWWATRPVLELHTAVSGLASQPRRYGPCEREAIMLAAANELWKVHQAQGSAR